MNIPPRFRKLLWIALVPVATLGVAGTMLFARGIRSIRRPWYVRLRMRLARRR